MGRPRDIEPIALAHHPSCSNFSHHTFTFRDRRLCLGCFVMYPAAAVSLAALLVLDRAYPLEYLGLLLSSLALFGINLVRKVILRDRIRKWGHVFFRIMLGLTLALALMSVVRAPANRQIWVAAFVVAVAAVYNLYNGIHNLNICRSCPKYPDFPRCEGASGFKVESPDSINIK
jgi:hypothetical protein